MANATPLRYSLTIGGTDYTNSFIEGQFSCSPYQEGDGLLLLSGSISLANHKTTLDPRVNANLKPGKKVQLYTPSGLAPVFGTMYIANSSYDAEQKVATLDLACLLGLLSYASFNEVGVCIEKQDEGITIQLAIENLLKLAGVQAYQMDIGSFPGTSNDMHKLKPGSMQIGQGQAKLYETRTVDTSSSFVQLAGELAYSQGYVLLQNRSGQIVKQKVSDRFAKLNGLRVISQEHLLQYTQKADAIGIPPGLVRVAGNRMWPILPASTVTTTTATTSTYGPVITTETRRYDRDKRKAYTERKVEAPIGYVSTDFISDEINPDDAYKVIIAERTYIVEEYEPKPDPWDCIKPDEGRLLKRTTTTWLPHFKTFGQYMLFKAELDGANPAGNSAYFKQKLVHDTTRVETWEYKMLQNFPLRGSVAVSYSQSTGSNFTNSPKMPEFKLLEDEYFVEKQIKTYRPRIAVFPYAGIAKFGRAPNIETSTIVGLSLYILELVELERVRWTLNADGQTWHEYNEQKVCQWMAYRDNVEYMLDLVKDTVAGQRYVYNQLDVLAAAFSLSLTTLTVNPQSSAADGGRFPPRTTYGRTPYYIDGKVSGVGSSIASRRRDIQVPDEMPPEIAAEYAQTALLREWGRSNATLINMPCDVVSSNFAPLDTIGVQEFDNETYLYECDSISLSITPKEGFYACIGLMAGRAGGGLPGDLWSGKPPLPSDDKNTVVDEATGNVVTVVADIWSNGFESADSMQFGNSNITFSRVLQADLLIAMGTMQFIGDRSDDPWEISITALTPLLTGKGEYIAYGS